MFMDYGMKQLNRDETMIGISDITGEIMKSTRKTLVLVKFQQRFSK